MTIEPDTSRWSTPATSATAERVADRSAGVRPGQWSRSDGAASTVTSSARYVQHDVQHDVVHHLHDVQEPGPR